MSPVIILLFMLVAVIALAGVLHLLVWESDAVPRHRLWFGLGCLAAAGAIAVYCVYPYMSDPALAVARKFSAFFYVSWLVAMTWFTVEYAAGNGRSRRLAGLLTVMFAAVILGHLAASERPQTFELFGGVHPLDVLNDIAFLGLCGLVMYGSAQLWRRRQRFRAVVLGAGMGAPLLQVAFYSSLLDPEQARLPTPVPHSFLMMVLLMAFELARSVEAAKSLLEQQRQEWVHTSRLAIVGELTASIAHEINQPLGAILSNADAGEILLERADPPLEAIGQILRDIRRDGLRASNVIRQVRTLARNQSFALEKLDANVLTEEVLGLIAEEARRRRMRLEHLPAPTPAYIRGDKARLEQVLLNLLLNAMDATESAHALDSITGSHSPIVLGVTQMDSDEIEIRVVDGGHGVPAERLDRLFDSFYTTKAHGMGMGLSIARSIVEAHGGWICAENNVPAGATFRVTLPPMPNEPEGA